MIDDKKIEEAIRLFLEGIGEDPSREGLKETPKRISAMCHELFGGMNQTAEEHLKKTFPSSCRDLVIEKDISFYSICEHHLLPFYGKAHIGYIPNGKVVGLSKLARTVEVYAKRAQIQEEMTAFIAGDIWTYLQPKGVIVMTTAEHMCMTMRGIKKPGSKTTSFAAYGLLEEEAYKNMFFQLLQ